MKMKLALLLILLPAAHARAGGRSALAREAAEAVVARFGAKAASRGVPALAQKIEVYAARYGDDTFLALRRVGPGAFETVEAAGEHGVKAMRVMAVHGEAGAAHVLTRPVAMRQFLRHGDDAAAVLVKHPGVAEQVVERGGMTAVKAMGAVGPQNGRRVAMLMEGELGRSAKTTELLEVIARYGDRGAAFVWNNKGALATGATLAAFLADPEAFMNGTATLAAGVGNGAKAVATPVVEGAVSTLKAVLAVVGLLIALVAALIWKHGPPSVGQVLQVASVWKR